MSTTVWTDPTSQSATDRPTIFIRFSPFLWLLRLLTVCLFCQLWFDIPGLTIRVEDLLSIILVISLLSPVILSGKMRYYRSVAYVPLLVWGSVLALGMIVTLISPMDSVTKKNALVNGVRLLLALSLFFVVFNHPASAIVKARVVATAIVLFSLVTTAVTLLQMGYWDGWLPFSLPAVLITFKEGANTAEGRQFFALYLGDTGSHAWSAALAMQALLIWLSARYTRRFWPLVFFFSYFALLVYILLRVSVRNSIVGLFFAIVVLELVHHQNTRDLILRLLRPLLIGVAVLAVLYFLVTFAPDSYIVDRIRQVIPRFEGGELIISRASNVYGRFEYWAIALQIFQANPILGGGFYSFQALSQQYGPEALVHAHNSYFHTLAELGILGAMALSLFVMSIGYILERARFYFLFPSLGSLWWEFTTGSFLFLAFTMVFSNALWSPNILAFRMIVFGVLMSFIRESRR